ncbi:hypothetical protein AWV80_27790 [Cupriavidus sp. UYMU48A]|nr:hypothetical protein AWV80_27790 [Cupriavidus sp. UYMU48A]
MSHAPLDRTSRALSQALGKGVAPSASVAAAVVAREVVIVGVVVARSLMTGAVACASSAHRSRARVAPVLSGAGARGVAFK